MSLEHSGVRVFPNEDRVVGVRLQSRLGPKPRRGERQSLLERRLGLGSPLLFAPLRLGEPVLPDL